MQRSPNKILQVSLGRSQLLSHSVSAFSQAELHLHPDRGLDGTGVGPPTQVPGSGGLVWWCWLGPPTPGPEMQDRCLS